MRIGVIGCGKVGFSHLEWLHNSGYAVKGLDCDETVQNRISRTLNPSIVAKKMEDLSACDSLHICVPTEPADDGSADLSIIEEIILEISRLFSDRTNLSVVQRSTCPPGTADRFSCLLGDGISYGVNPSFLRKASIIYDTENPERIAIGGNGLVVEHLDAIYKKVCSPRFYSENRTAVELLKYVENSLDSLLISYWNEIFEYSTLIGLPPSEMVMLLEHIGDRPKFRSVVRVPGKAFGMWCLPKDIEALLACMKDAGVNAATIQGAHETNQRFLEREGYGEKSAKMLWDDCSNDSKILADGVRQIEEYARKNNG
jgi:UDPglucose 6-dehydrogenase